MGQCPDAELLLDWAVDHRHQAISQSDVKQCGPCLDADPVQVSQRMWGWLQMPLLNSGTPELTYNNAEVLNGLEVWRSLVVPVEPRSVAQRFALRDKVQNPQKCTSFAEVMVSFKVWEKVLVEFVKAGGAAPPDEERRHALLKMLPGGLSLEMNSKAHSH